MTPDSDSYDDMNRFALGDHTVEQLFSGAEPGPGTGREVHDLSALFGVATGPATAKELAGRQLVASACAAAVPPQAFVAAPRRKHVLSKFLTAKVAAAATVAALGAGTAAAAATGSLPTQTTHVSTAVGTGQAATAHRGAHGNAAGQTTSGAIGTNTAGGIPATGPANKHAQFGLCTAFLAAGSGASGTSDAAGSSDAADSADGTDSGSGAANPSSGPSSGTLPQYSSHAFSALIAQNGGVDATTAYCEKLTTARHPGSGSGSAKPSDAGKPAGAGQSGTAGKPATPNPASGQHPSGSAVPTPNPGGTGTADSASGGSSASGTSTAGTASHGASNAGSATVSGR